MGRGLVNYAMNVPLHLYGLGVHDLGLRFFCVHGFASMPPHTTLAGLLRSGLYQLQLFLDNPEGAR